MANCPSCDGKLPQNTQTCPYCGADTSWWLTRDGEVYGPYDEATVRYILRDKRARKNDLAMIGSDGQWRPLHELLEETPHDLTAGTSLGDSGGDRTREDKYRHWSGKQWLIFAGVLVVVCVGATCAIVGPTYRDLTARNAQAHTRAGLEQIWLALEVYAAHHDGRFPAQGEWVETLEGFVGAETLHTPAGRRYWFNENLGGKELASLSHPETLIVAAQPGAMSEKPPDRDFLYLYADGHIEAVRTCQDTSRTEP